MCGVWLIRLMGVFIGREGAVRSGVLLFKFRLVAKRTAIYAFWGDRENFPIMV